MEDEVEEWKDLHPEFECSNYQISSMGRIRNKGTMYVLNPVADASNQIQVGLYSDSGKRVNKLMHVLVARSFLEHQGEVVDHIDKDKTNNKLKNLRFTTRSEIAKRERTPRERDREPCTDLLGETWKQIPLPEGYKPVYASSFGRIKNHGGFLLKQILVGGYLKTSLSNQGSHSWRTHRLVCMAFHGMPQDSSTEVNHVNGNKQDNIPSNLEWITHAQNIRHAFDTGLVKRKRVDPRGVSVTQKNKDGNEIARFQTIHEAGKKVGISYKTIHGVLSGHGKTAGGFLWEYTDGNKKSRIQKSI